MATSGTFAWNLDVLDLIEEAYEQAGLESTEGYDLETARRSLSLILTNWSNEGVNLWRIVEDTQLLTTGTATYTLNAKYYGVLDAVLERVVAGETQTTSMVNVSMQEYLDYPDKTQQGKPTHYSMRKNRDSITMTVWPTSDGSATSDTVRFYALREPEDIGAYDNNVDVPKRFLPALITQLAAFILMKQPFMNDANLEQIRMARVQSLFELGDVLLQKAKDEDRERSDFIIVPSLSWRGRRG